VLGSSTIVCISPSTPYATLAPTSLPSAPTAAPTHPTALPTISTNQPVGVPTSATTAAPSKGDPTHNPTPKPYSKPYSKPHFKPHSKPQTYSAPIYKEVKTVKTVNAKSKDDYVQTNKDGSVRTGKLTSWVRSKVTKTIDYFRSK